MAIKLSKDAQDLMQDVYDLDGMEVPAPGWEAPNVKELEEHGLVEWSGARGPGRAWKRLTATEKGAAFMLKDKYDL